MREGPAAQDSTLRRPVRESLCHGKADHSFSTLLDGMHLPAELMDDGSMTQGITQTEGVCTLLRHGYCLVVPHQPLLRIAKNAQRTRSYALAHHPSVLAIAKRISAVL